jgi:hypothetical protein
VIFPGGGGEGMSKTLHQQFREQEDLMRQFARDGDIRPDEAEKIIDDLRRGIKALRPDKA